MTGSIHGFALAWYSRQYFFLSDTHGSHRLGGSRKERVRSDGYMQAVESGAASDKRLGKGEQRGDWALPSPVVFWEARWPRLL